MRMERQNHVYAPFELKADKALAEKFLLGQGAAADLSEVPPTYMIFLRGETRGVDLFGDLDIPREKALHGGQRYEWSGPIGWGDALTVTATVENISEKNGKGGRFWSAEVAFDYVRPDGVRVLREITRLIERE